MKQCPKCNSLSIKHSDVYDYFDFYECANCKSIFSLKIDDCCRNPDTIFVIEYYSNNRLSRIIKQCTNCGGAFKNQKFSFKTHGELIESEFSQINFDNWNEKKNNEKLDINERFEVLQKSRFYNYDKYLQSKEWKIIRDKVIQRDNGICLHCNTNPAQEVHHKHYKTIYKENISDLESVCTDCHRAIHKVHFYEVLKGQ